MKRVRSAGIRTKTAIKALTLSIVFLLSMAMLTGCVGADGQDAKLSYYDSIETMGERGDYNHNLFYRNDLNTYLADPCIIYAEEGPGAGYYYIYGTSDELLGAGLMCYRSKNMNDWEYVGPVIAADGESWALSSYWAPDIAYDSVSKNYYLYFSGYNRIVGVTNNYSYKDLTVAVSKTPYGPFTEVTENADGPIGYYSDEELEAAGAATGHKVRKPALSLGEAFKAGKYATGFEDKGDNFSSIDMNLFRDDDGKMYLYFVCDYVTYPIKHNIYVMEMKDYVTPDYKTFTQVIQYGKESMAPDAKDVDQYAEGGYEGTDINEGPFVIKHKNKYYMTYSTFGAFEGAYKVCLAVSDNPMSGFVKTGPLLYTAGFDHIRGSGHNAMIQVGDEWFIVYHALSNPETTDRALAIDRIVFQEDKARGFDMPYVNGPTSSIQPLPEAVSGYRNVALEASVSASAGDIATKKFLNDGAFAMHAPDWAKEFLGGKKETVITLRFDKAVDISAIMIYNSADYELALDKIDRIEFETEKDSVGFYANTDFSGKLYLEDLRFNTIYKDNTPGLEFMQPGGAAIAEFDELKVTQIKITVDAGKEFAISDIVVLGK